MFVVALSFIFSCSTEPITSYKADDIIGFWRATQTSNVSVNGTASTSYEEEYLITFFSSNCGKIDNSDGSWANDIKWAIQEGKEEDLLMISVALNSSGESTDRFINNIHTVEFFERKNFSTIWMETDTVNGNIHVTEHLTEFIRIS